MGIVFVVLEAIGLGLIILSTHMIEHKYQMLQVGMKKYASRRTYKTQAEIAFIEDLIKQQKKRYFDTEPRMDIGHKIKMKLEEEYIGHFNYLVIKKMGLFICMMMWLILLAQGACWYFQKGIQHPLSTVLLSVSLGLVLLMQGYRLLKRINQKEEKFIKAVINYMTYEYPEQIRKYNKKSMDKEWEDHLAVYLTEAAAAQEDDKRGGRKIRLTAKDIASMLKKL